MRAPVLSATSRIHDVDLVVNNFFNTIRQPQITKVFIFITNIATPTNLTIVGSGLALYFIYRHRWYFLILLPAALLSGVLSDSILKKMVHVARPIYPLVSTTDFSFPSGHATVAIIFCCLLAYYFKDEINSKLTRNIYILVCAFLALIVCLSRLYLNAHWFSDVLAGAALGLFWVTLYIVLFHFFTSFSTQKVEFGLEKELK